MWSRKRYEIKLKTSSEKFGVQAVLTTNGRVDDDDETISRSLRVSSAAR